MKRIFVPIVCVSAVALAGCTAPISNSLPNDILSSAASGAIGQQVQSDLAATQYNLVQAVAVGALSPNDPAPACVNQAVATLGLGAQGKRFTPQLAGVVSAASIAYIRAQQVKALAGSGTLQIPPACLQILGQMQLDALAAAIKAAPGGGLLPVLSTAPVSAPAAPAAAPVPPPPVAAEVNPSLDGN
ncbi:MAG: hypothetical protein KGL35_13790 [Bradyrhizobium sp.]|nr:hypothetical protein [Bradyrhizobium sp.]